MLLSEVNCLVIGAGPAGLAAARALVDGGEQSVLVVDRDEAPGGLPQYCRHPGFGWAYTHRFETGPAFARRMIAALEPARVRILSRTTATTIRPGPIVDLVGAECGMTSIAAGAVILATGIRERPRAARLVPGRRPERGVLTTGQLQQMAARGIALAGQRLVIVGTEHVAFSVLLTARHAKQRVVAMIETADRPASYAMLAGLTRYAGGISVHYSTSITNILGRRCVEAVEIDGPAGRQEIACDAVVFTGDFVPDSVLARESEIEMDPHTLGPAIDQYGRTSMKGVFAAGNVLRAVETSGFAAIEGARAGAAALSFLRDQIPWGGEARPIQLAPEFAYVVPQRWSDEKTTLSPIPFSLRAARDLNHARVAVAVGDTIVWKGSSRHRRRHHLIRFAPPAVITQAAVGASLKIDVTS